MEKFSSPLSLVTPSSDLINIERFSIRKRKHNQSVAASSQSIPPKRCPNQTDSIHNLSENSNSWTSWSTSRCLPSPWFTSSWHPWKWWSSTTFIYRWMFLLDFHQQIPLTPHQHLPHFPPLLTPNPHQQSLQKPLSQLHSPLFPQLHPPFLLSLQQETDGKTLDYLNC